MQPDSIAQIVSDTVSAAPNAKLNCLPYSRVLHLVLTHLNRNSTPLVTRAIVFGPPNQLDWSPLVEKLDMNALFKQTVQGEHANGFHLFVSKALGEIKIPYRTLGYTHGNAELGSFESDGSWNGHISVVSDGTLYDLTIGQLNDHKLSIAFNPGYLTTEADSEFLNGTKPLMGLHEGMFVVYQAFPAEVSFLQSQSWTPESAFHSQLTALASTATAALVEAGINNANAV